MEIQSMFKTKRVKETFMGRAFLLHKYQCPMCKKWLTSYSHNSGGLLQHITIIAKKEAVAKLLGEMKKIPHFNFWKKYTRISKVYYQKRVWAIS